MWLMINKVSGLVDRWEWSTLSVEGWEWSTLSVEGGLRTYVP